ncbi:MAG: glycosyltransferase family 2 protein [Patescibacteria group bacterium]|nr:glycosyltransferase family 2 protein [Patescibacteria group bacterium]
MNQIKTSIIIPAYNEEKGIEKVIANVKKHLNQECEIIVVNDGSTDRTKNILEQMPSIKVINHLENRGYGAALKSGIQKARGGYVLIIDADGTYPTESISDLLNQKERYDMVVGARINPQSQIPLARKPVKWLLTQLANYLTGTKIPDLNSGLRIIKGDVLNQFIHLLPDGFSFTTTITLALLTNNYQVKYFPINYYKRKGESKIKPIRDTLNFLQLIIRTILYFNPLKVFIPISLILFLLSLGVLVYSYFFTPQIMDITIVIFFISAIQILAIGMIADLIVKSRK